VVHDTVAARQPGAMAAEVEQQPIAWPGIGEQPSLQARANILGRRLLILEIAQIVRTEAASLRQQLAEIPHVVDAAPERPLGVLVDTYKEGTTSHDILPQYTQEISSIIRPGSASG